MALRVITAPTEPGLITLEQARAQIRELGELEDVELGDLILDASDHVEDYVNRRYLAQTLEWTLERWHNPMILPLAPFSTWDQVTINSIRAVPLQGEPDPSDPMWVFPSWDGTTAEVSPLLYWARAAGPTVKIVKRWFVIWPFLGDGAERVIINFSFTGGDVTTVPRNVQRAVRLLVSHWHRNRDAVVGVDGRDSSTELPLGVRNLLFREMWDQPARV